MGTARMDPRKQFSKRLARWTAVFWFVYLTWLSGIMLLQPNTAQYVFYMSIVVSVVMIVNVISYTRNSLFEKAMLTVLDKTKLEVSVGRAVKSSVNVEEEGENG